MGVLCLVLMLSGLVYAGDKVELTYYFPGSSQRDEDKVHEAFNQLLEEKGYNFTVNFKRLDWGQYNEKMKLIIGSGQNYDLCFTASWSNNFYDNVRKGAFIPIGDLIDEHAPKLKSELPDFIWGAGERNNKIYAVPNYQIIYSHRGFAIPEEIAKDVGITADKINKYEDIAKFLPEVKEKYPDLYTIETVKAHMMFIFENIGGTETYIKIDEPGYKVYYGEKYNNISEESLEVDLMHREWARKGYIRPDKATVKDVRPDIDAGKYAIWEVVCKPGVEAEMKVTHNRDIKVIPYSEPYLPMKAGDATMTAISTTSENPEEAIKLIELLNTDKELYRLLCQGIEGEHFEIIGEEEGVKIIRHLEDSGYKPNTSWMFGNVFNDYLLEGQSLADREETDRINRKAKVSKLRGFYPDIEPIKMVLARIKAIESPISKWMDLDDDEGYIESFKKQYEKELEMGGRELAEEIQRQVDEWVEANK